MRGEVWVLRGDRQAVVSDEFVPTLNNRLWFGDGKKNCWRAGRVNAPVDPTGALTRPARLRRESMSCSRTKAEYTTDYRPRIPYRRLGDDATGFPALLSIAAARFRADARR